MKALVCFKSAPDLGMVSGEDWRTADWSSAGPGFVKSVFNCFDESALEIGLKLSDRAAAGGISLDLTTLTIDDSSADIFLRQLLALQYNSAVRVTPDKGCDLRFNPLLVSGLIASYVTRTGHQPLVILGSQGSVGSNGRTGMLVAERLGRPCISGVTGVVPGPSPDCLTITSRSDGAVVEQTLTPPVVLIIGNAPDSPFLRVPTLKQKLGAAKKKISVLSFADLEADSINAGTGDKTLINLQYKEPGKSCTFIDGKTPMEKAHRLFNRYLAERLTG